MILLIKTRQKNNKYFLFIMILLVFGLIFLSAYTSVVVNNGMVPAIYGGGLVLTQNVNTYGIQEFNPYTDVNVGDVVIYNASWYGGPVIHRVITIEFVNGSKYYVLNGDHNDLMDPYLVSPEQIYSKAIGIDSNLMIIPKLVYIFLWLRCI